ncbi:radical SAM protein [Thermodesulfovibrio sp.]|uniref:radical SAM protein n=1 Tax=Thermodesulfovibrio sp. TaxID=2067987 RepID=UPI0030A1EF04
MQLLKKFLMPSLSWIQLEISGLCNASCFYCPHTVFRKNWKGRNLSLSEFNKILPFLKKTELLYLQGWGEPFCNPDFFTFVEIAKKYNTKVGTTTNGTLIEEKHLEKMVDLQMDIIAFSLTGIKKNDTLRQGTSIEKILKTVDKLNEIKLRKNSQRPNINIAYLLLKSNLEELENIPEIFHSRGIENIVVSFLDFIPDKSLEEESLMPKDEEDFKRLSKIIQEITEKAKIKNLSIFFNLPHPFKRREVCSEKPTNALFINSLGFVSPCVFTGLPFDSEQNIHFGNINERSLESLWFSKNYRKFRKAHVSSAPPSVCKNCPKLRIT